MSGHAVYMNYHFIHFCVKAEPASLLSVSVEYDGEFLDLEEVADLAIPEDNQFAIIPKDQACTFAICKAIGVVHPEFKIELKSLDEDETDGGSDRQDSDDDSDKYILCTMPVVDENRHDFGMDYVKTIHDETLVKIDAVNTAYVAKITKALVGAKPEEIDEAKEELQKFHDQHVDMCKQYREEKEKQIEAAYQDYLKSQAEKENAEQEKQAAHDSAAGKQFNLDEFVSGEG